MKAEVIFEQSGHKWIVFGRDPEKPGDVIDTNEYIVVAGGKTLILDPGGTEIFPEVVTAISSVVPIDSVVGLFGSHQDPDILSSLSMWLGICPKDVQIYIPWTWTGFVTHFGCRAEQMSSVPDEGGEIRLSHDCTLQIVPAHYLHSSGNIHLYDPKAKIYFSGDVGAALLPEDEQSLYVQDFDKHIKYMEGFHRRWMPSNRARDVWLDRVRRLDIEQLCPQHGSIFQGKDVERFFDWFASLELGSAVGGSSSLGGAVRKESAAV